MISDENSYVSKLCATANEHAPKMLEEKSEENDSKVNFDAWIKPKSAYQQCVFLKKYIKEDKFEDVNNKHNMMIDDDENNEEEVEMKEKKENGRRKT